MWVHHLLLFTGIAVAWFPVETHAASGILVAATLLVLTPWMLDKTDHSRLVRTAGPVTLVAVALLSQLGDSWDLATASSELALFAGAIGLAYAASRTPPPSSTIRCFAIAISVLALWAIWQVTVGFQQVLPPLLPPDLQAVAQARLDGGRAFASLLLPGHFAAMLTTAMCVLLADTTTKPRSWPALIGIGLCGAGLALSWSAFGFFLAISTVAVFAASRCPRRLPVVLAAVPAFAATSILVHLWRPDLLPVAAIGLRLDNWRTALWLWSTSPLRGVGLGSYGQASQAVPFAVGNRPQHAHNLPLEWLAELGPFGLALAVFAAVAVLGLARRLWPRRPALAIAIMIVPVHNLADFSLFTSGVAIPWALLLGWSLAVARGETDEPERTPPLTVRVAAVVAAGVAVLITVFGATSTYLERAAIHDIESRPEQAMTNAARAFRIAPWRAEPIAVFAEAALAQGGAEAVSEALALLEEGRRLRLHSGLFSGYRSRGAVLTGRFPEAAAEAWSATHAFPQRPDHQQHFLTLIENLHAVR